ncbi:hypothetical protein CRG98_018943 [Punica granatum]|uniref:Uncharacterized protein n=1 Tax=Punica granatum TaxID=22663 RepID=A0A2I0JZ22_PUNGR|nr:hypothetical protein CRG98_018943 [Punica granatum]
MCGVLHAACPSFSSIPMTSLWESLPATSADRAIPTSQPVERGAGWKETVFLGWMVVAPDSSHDRRNRDCQQRQESLAILELDGGSLRFWPPLPQLRSPTTSGFIGDLT